ncbi:hypothetical protein B0A48_04350 [Cryoendolithus antarcticus]|uniref:Uncharacterized protein n=1 Tax=Cryoendolithus antarcticus TaxID=1507870 RepID=A0A1V8TF47_9PEZI|nr:hypothetical protein B0A48_04350 [Cryoendolithus antarcticus]
MGSLDNPIAKSTTEAKVFERFDELHARGELLWEPNEPIHIPQHPFDAYIRVSPALVTKPYNPGDTSRKPAFTDDPPEYTLCNVGPAHKLILNKYCWVRPQLILHTLEYESQRDGLTLRDVDTTWRVLEMLGSGYMAIFNGGPEAGGSIAHKHVQIMPKPGWEMFPGRCLTEDPESTFQYPAHNAVLTSSWLIVLPRTQAEVDGCAAGAQAMLGDIWTKTNEQVQQWQVLQPMTVLAKLGVQASAL